MTARALVAGLLFALVSVQTLARQATDPKADFVQALARFSLALDGAYGDEGSSIRSNIEAMSQRLTQWDAVIQSYEAAMTRELVGADPQLAARMHLALGGVYLNRGRVQDAAREFAAARQLDATRADVHTLLGLAYDQLANEPSATEAVRTASALDPGDPVRAYTLARRLLKGGDVEETSKALQRFRESQKQRAASQGRAATAAPFIRLGLVPEASNVEPFFPPALYARGFALLRQGEYEGAIGQFRDAAARDSLTSGPGAQADATRRAADAFRDGMVEIARQHLEAAIELAPDRAEPHRVLGRVFVADQQYEKAIAELRAAIRLSPDEERARLGLADAFAESGQFAAAEQSLRETIQTLPASGRARYALARLYQRQGQYQEALREFQEAVTFQPLLGLSGIYQTMGALEAARQNFDAAVDAYSKRVEVHPNHADAHQDLGATYFRQGRHDEALAEFTVVLMLDPTHAEAYAAIGQVHLRDARYLEASDAARHALELNATHKEARYVLATSLMRLGKVEEGKQELQVFQRLQSDEAEARARLFELEGLRREASVSAGNGDHEKAVAILRKALLAQPGAAASHLELALALVAAGHTAEAIERFKAAAALNAHFDVHRHLAEAYAAAGQIEESRREQAIYERMKQEALRRSGASR